MIDIKLKMLSQGAAEAEGGAGTCRDGECHTGTLCAEARSG